MMTTFGGVCKILFLLANQQKKHSLEVLSQNITRVVAELVMIKKLVVTLLLASATDAFVPVARSKSSNALRFERTGGPQHSIRQGSRTWMVLERAEKVEQKIDGPDVTELGSLKVPSVGIGTISWSSDSSKYTYQRDKGGTSCPSYC
jgi:hypothetical protein